MPKKKKKDEGSAAPIILIVGFILLVFGVAIFFSPAALLLGKSGNFINVLLLSIAINGIAYWHYNIYKQGKRKESAFLLFAYAVIVLLTSINYIFKAVDKSGVDFIVIKNIFDGKFLFSTNLESTLSTLLVIWIFVASGLAIFFLYKKVQLDKLVKEASNKLSQVSEQIHSFFEELWQAGTKTSSPTKSSLVDLDNKKANILNFPDLLFADIDLAIIPNEYLFKYKFELQFCLTEFSSRQDLLNDLFVAYLIKEFSTDDYLDSNEQKAISHFNTILGIDIMKQYKEEMNELVMISKIKDERKAKINNIKSGKIKPIDIKIKLEKDEKAYDVLQGVTLYTTRYGKIYIEDESIDLIITNKRFIFAGDSLISVKLSCINIIRKLDWDAFSLDYTPRSKQANVLFNTTEIEVLEAYWQKFA